MPSATSAFASIAILLSGALALSWFNSAEVRYRVSVDIEENGVTRTGSSVWSWKLSKALLALASPYNGRFQAEAVAVELASGATVYALIVDEQNSPLSAKMLPERVFDDIAGDAEDRVQALRRISRATGTERLLDRWHESISDSMPTTSQYPMLVWFSDEKDPTSMKLIDPAALGSSMGNSARLKGIRIQITDAPVTLGIRDRLPWLEANGRERATILPYRSRTSGDTAPVELVSAGAFTTELYR